MQSVQVIIERLKTNPEDFFGGLEDTKLRHLSPKFSTIREKLDDLLLEKTEHPHRLWYLNEDEKLALLEAYKQARRERFEAKVFHTLLTKPDEAELNLVTRQHPKMGKQLMQGPSSIIAPQNMIKAATKILNDEFDKQYAKNRNT